jgi:hypothetical protein
MNSTATILSPSEEPLLGSQSTHDLGRRRRLPSLPNSPARQATIAIGPTKSATKSPTANPSAKSHSTPPPPPPPPTLSQPTNYVYISRKCNPSMPIPKSRERRRKTVLQQPKTQIPPPLPKLSSSSSSSAITGTFTINPELYIPPSLLNAMEDPVFFRFKPSSSDTGETRKRKGSRRRTNLRLEVENGGIDVDIHLVPTTVSANVGEDEATCTENRGQQQDTSFCDTPIQAQASASTSTTAFSGPPSSTTTHRRLSMQENPSSGISSSRKGVSTPEVTQHNSSRRDKKEPSPSRPTTIDLRIMQAYYQQCSLIIQNQDSVKINGPIAFPLIARIVSFYSRLLASIFQKEKKVVSLF